MTAFCRRLHKRDATISYLAAIASAAEAISVTSLVIAAWRALL
jgi:hypothetical protein